MATTVVLSVQDQFSQPLNDYAMKVGAAEEVTAGLATGMAEADAAAVTLSEGEMEAAAATGALEENTQVASATMKDFLGPMVAIGIATAALKGAYDATVGSTLALSDQVRKLSRDIGSSSEESSKLIYAANTVGISVDAMTKSFDMAINKMRSHRSDGIAPTIEGLGQLSDKYLAIQDPIQRTQFLIDQFGRSGANLAPLMALGSQGIKDLGDQATATGTVMSQDAVDAAFKYEQSIKALGSAFTGLKVSIANEAIPAISGIVGAMSDQVKFQGLLTQAQRLGIDTSRYVNTTTQDGIVITTNQKEATFELTGAIAAQTAAMAQTTDASDRLSGLQQDATVATNEWSDATSNGAFQHGVYASQLAGENKVIQDNISAQRDAATANELAAGLAGTLTTNTERYTSVVDGNAKKIADLRAEIAKYNDAQGQSVTVVNKGQYSAEQLAVAQERLRIAQERLTEGHYKTQAALDTATLSVRTAQDAVDKMAGSQATATTTTANYSAKIAEDQAALDKLTGANHDAEDAMKKANAQFLFQSASAGLDAGAQLELAKSLGIVDTKTYNVDKTIEGLKKELADGKITREQFITDVANMAKGLDSLHNVDLYITTHYNATGIDSENSPPPSTGSYVPPPPYVPPNGHDEGGGTSTTNTTSSASSGGTTVHVHVHGSISSVGAAAALGSVLAQQVRAQGLAGAATMGN